MKRFKVSVLGTQYEVSVLERHEDETLSADADMDGYFDPSVKKLVVCVKEGDSNSHTPGKMDDMLAYRAAVLRHEMAHAFLYESGLDCCNDFARNEELIDWIALQIGKMWKAMQIGERKLRETIQESDKGSDPEAK